MSMVNIDELYIELVGRIDHIDRAFITRRHILLHYAKAMPHASTGEYIKVRQKYSEFFAATEEALLWFITVELWSRFTANSRKGLRALIYRLDDEELKSSYTQFKKSNEEVVVYINIQRTKYFAHADAVSWSDFPNIWDKEYEKIIGDIRQLLCDVRLRINSSRIPTGNQRLAAEHTDLLFDDLLQQTEPKLDIMEITSQFQSGLSNFVDP